MAATAFGTMGEDANLNVVKSLTSLGDSFDNVGGAASKMNENATTESQKLEGNMRKMDDAFAGVGEVLAKLANEILPPVADGISAIGDFFAAMPEPVQDFVAVLGGLIVVLTTLAPTIAAVAFAVKNLEISLLPIILTVVGIAAAITAVIVIFQNWDSIVQWFNEQWSNFTAALGDMWENFCTWFEEKMNDIATWFSDLADDISKGVDDIVDFFAELPSNLKKWLDKTIDNIASWGSKMIAKGVEAAKDMIDGIADFFKSLPGKALEWGADMIDGFVEGIKDAAGGVVDAVSDVADTITSWLHFSRPDVGPLREYEKWMPDMMQGLSKGIRNNKWRVEDEISSLADSMILMMNPNIETSAKTQYMSEMTVNVTVPLDGRIISKSTESYITKGQRSRRIVKGL